MLKKSAVRSVLKLIGRKRSRAKFMLTCRTNSSSTQNQFRFAKDYGKMYSPTFFFAMYYGPQLSSVTSPKMVCVQNTEAPDNQNNFLNHNVEEQLWRSPQLLSIYRAKTRTNKPKLTLEESLMTIFYCSWFKNKLETQTHMNTDVICDLRYYNK